MIVLDVLTVVLAIAALGGLGLLVFILAEQDSAGLLAVIVLGGAMLGLTAVWWGPYSVLAALVGVVGAGQ